MSWHDGLPRDVAAMAQVDQKPTVERCAKCAHTLEGHEVMGWTCDCCDCPWKSHNARPAAVNG